MVKTERKSNRRRKEVADQLVLPRSAELAEWRRLQQRNLSILGLLKRKVALMPQRERAVGKYARATFAKRKKNRAISPKHQTVRGKGVQVSEYHTLARKRQIRVRARKEKSGLHHERRRVPKKKGRASKKSLPRGSRW